MQCCSANNCSESDSGHELDTGGRRQLQSCKVMQSNDTKCIMQINAKWCKLVHVNASKSMQCKRDHYWWHEADERQCQRGRHLPRPDSTSDYLSILCPACMMVLYGIVPWFECQLIIQYPERGLLPSNLVTGQGSYHLLSPYWPPVPNQVDGLTLLDQAGQAALQFCQPEDALSFIANATAGTFNQRGMCAHIYYSCLKSAALECKLSIILKV